MTDNFSFTVCVYISPRRVRSQPRLGGESGVFAFNFFTSPVCIAPSAPFCITMLMPPWLTTPVNRGFLAAAAARQVACALGFLQHASAYYCHASCWHHRVCPQHQLLLWIRLKMGVMCACNITALCPSNELHQSRRSTVVCIRASSRQPAWGIKPQPGW